MSLPINLLITTLLIYVVGAFISLAVRRNEQLSINISGVTGVLDGVLEENEARKLINLQTINTVTSHLVPAE